MRMTSDKSSFGSRARLVLVYTRFW